MADSQLRPVLLELDGVGFAYPGAVASLSGVSLTVREGERVAIVGANGSGKSTLLHLAAGLFFPSSGVVRAFDRALTPEALDGSDFGSAFRQRVGFLFQNSAAQLFCPTVFDELAFGPLQLDWPAAEIERRIADTLALLGLIHLWKRSPNTLSAGEQKQVALASLLVLSPSVLLLDEPTAGLDPRRQSSLLDLLDALHSRGLTMLTATHELTLIPHLADRVVVLSEDHRLVADGPAAAILADTDLLLSVNLIHAHRHRHGDLVHSHPHDHVVAHDHRHGED
jgi:cobalt/nickel transport system ATP-binding protein